MNLAVIIPTWKRVTKLKNALKSLEDQDEKPKLLVLTVRSIDLETVAYVSEWKKLTPLEVEIIYLEKPGVIHAENMAIAHLQKDTSIDLVTFMDDDAIASKNWVKDIKTFFQTHPEAAGVGGPDFIVAQPWTYENVHVDVVGKITYLGKVIGNHHHRSTGIKEVDVLKGVNMSFRKKYLTLLDERLQGTDPAKGNGVFWELDLCLEIGKMGGQLFFDPTLLIQHDSDHSHFIHHHVISSTSHNMTLVMMKHLPVGRKLAFLLYSFFIGNNNIKGLVKTAVEVIKRKNLSPFREFKYSMMGFLSGLKA